MNIQVISNEKPSTPPPPLPAAENRGEKVEAGTQDSQGSGTSSEQVTESKEPEASQNESPESETEETVETKGETEEPRKKGGFQRRIDKLNAKNAQTQQELEYWKQQAIKNASATKGEPPKQEPPQQTGKPKADDFGTHAEFVEALADWKMEQKLRDRDQTQQKRELEREQTKTVQTYQEKLKSFSEKNPDFQDVISEVDHIPLSPSLRAILLNSENGPELSYLLAKNPQEFERISRLPPLDCAREVGKFEAKISSAKSTASTEERRITNAPRPIDPVGTGGKGSSPKSIFDASLSQREYEAIRKEQINKRKGRA